MILTPAGEKACHLGGKAHQPALIIRKWTSGYPGAALPPLSAPDHPQASPGVSATIKHTYTGWPGYLSQAGAG